MSTPKKKSPPFNLQLVPDEEVGITLERLIDSVVMEVAADRSALQPQQLNESNDDALDIDSLPDDIIVEIFSYLKQNQLGQIARLCKRWNVLTKSPVLWKKVTVKFSPSHRCQTTVADDFLEGLPSCVNSIKLDFVKRDDWNEVLNFWELCLRLQEKCPHLEELILINSVLSNCFPYVLDLCSEFLQDVKNLIFDHSTFRCDRLTEENFKKRCSKGERFRISKIEILGLFRCKPHLGFFRKFPFSKMRHLKELHLFGKNVNCLWPQESFVKQLHVLNLGSAHVDYWYFSRILNHGHNLKELYLCSALIHSLRFIFTASAFPHLKAICLGSRFLTCVDVVYLIQSCPSLEIVYVRECVAESFATHPFVVANRCLSGIVKATVWNHKHNVNYSHT